jgi:hypothetical protein
VIREGKVPSGDLKSALICISNLLPGAPRTPSGTTSNLATRNRLAIANLLNAEVTVEQNVNVLIEFSFCLSSI